jgi:hypothetical protein
MTAQPERLALALDLSSLSVVDLGRIVADLEAAAFRARRRRRSGQTTGDEAVIRFLDWIAGLVEEEAKQRDRALREAARGER